MKIVGIIFFCFSLVILISLEIFFSRQKIRGDKTLFHFYKKNMKKLIAKEKRMKKKCDELLSLEKKYGGR